MDIVTTSNFHATLLRGQVSVVFLPAEFIRQSSWPLLNLLLYGGCGFDENESGCVVAEAHLCRSVQTEIFSVAWDRDGATLFMDPSGVDMFKRAGVDATITIAPQQWRAIQIHLGPMVAEFPGVVSFLSKLLAEDQISILNMSTYDTDVIYVQEQDLEVAISCLQSKLSRGMHGLKEAKDAETARDPVSPTSADDAEAKVSTTEGDDGCTAISVSGIVDSGQYLVVYPESLVLVRLQKEALRENAYGLTQLVLMSDSADDRMAERTPDEGFSFWCYCETAEEVSLIMHERCLSAFAEDSMIVSPDRWRAIKLCGRTYGFDETGVVAAMSGCSTDTQVLNISCFGSNVTLVLDHMVDESLAVLCESLQISKVVR